MDFGTEESLPYRRTESGVAPRLAAVPLKMACLLVNFSVLAWKNIHNVCFHESISYIQENNTTQC